MDIATIPFTDGRLQGLRGDFSARLSELQVSEQSCQSASGTVRTDVLQRNGGQIQWTGPELTGPIRCESGALIADLSGRDAEQTITALVKICVHAFDLIFLWRGFHRCLCQLAASGYANARGVRIADFRARSRTMRSIRLVNRG